MGKKLDELYGSISDAGFKAWWKEYCWLNDYRCSMLEATQIAFDAWSAAQQSVHPTAAGVSAPGNNSESGGG